MGRRLPGFVQFVTEYGLVAGPWATPITIYRPGKTLHLATAVSGMTKCGLLITEPAEVAPGLLDIEQRLCRNCQLPRAFIATDVWWTNHCVMLFDAYNDLRSIRRNLDDLEASCTAALTRGEALHRLRVRHLNAQWPAGLARAAKPSWDAALQRLLREYSTLVGSIVGDPHGDARPEVGARDSQPTNRSASSAFVTDIPSASSVISNKSPA